MPVKKEGNVILWDSVDGPGEHHASDINQSETDKYRMTSLMWDLMNKPNWQIRKRLSKKTDSHWRGGGWGGRRG